jgi:hypothetical protein
MLLRVPNQARLKIAAELYGVAGERVDQPPTRIGSRHPRITHVASHTRITRTAIRVPSPIHRYPLGERRTVQSA